MPTQEKMDVVAEIKQQLQENSIAVLTRYVGINAGQSTDLRRKLREGHVSFKVYKNTLAKRALDELELSGAAPFMEGPTAWAFSKDPVAPAKILKEFSAAVPLVSMAGGILDGKIIDKKQLIALADLPSREVLLTQLAGVIAAPMRNLAGALSALPRNLASVLDQVRIQKEKAGAAA